MNKYIIASLVASATFNASAMLTTVMKQSKNVRFAPYTVKHAPMLSRAASSGAEGKEKNIEGSCFDDATIKRWKTEEKEKAIENNQGCMFLSGCLSAASLVGGGLSIAWIEAIHSIKEYTQAEAFAYCLTLRMMEGLGACGLTGSTVVAVSAVSALAVGTIRNQYLRYQLKKLSEESSPKASELRIQG